MSRTGKIAQLPETIRDQVSQRLADGHPAKAILAWLNQLPEVCTLLGERFHGRPLNICNLSQWRQGGYQDWLDRRDCLNHVQQLSNLSSGLAAANQASIAQGAATLASAKLFRAVKLADDTKTEPARLGKVAQALAALRNAEIAAARLLVEQQKLELWNRQIALLERRVQLLEAKAASTQDPGAPATGGLSEETLTRIREAAQLL